MAEYLHFVQDTARTGKAAGLSPLELARQTDLGRFAELRTPLPDTLDKDQARAIVRELKAVGGNLRAVRRALTGRDSGPELWSVLAALPRDETLCRIDAAL